LGGKNNGQDAVTRAVTRWRQVEMDASPGIGSSVRSDPDPWDLMDLYLQEQALNDEDLDLLSGNARPARMSKFRFRARPGRTLLRVLRWIAEIFRLFLMVGVDLVVGRRGARDRARRIREMLQRAGGTMVKLGQQMSLRADLLPYEYCVELGSLLDEAPGMDQEVAREVVEARLGPVERAFADFDWDPIGSASIACVYRAQRHDGRDVAVKIRRPGVGPRFSADLAIMGWIARRLEGLGVMREGHGRDLVKQLREILADELDFRQEARYAELFDRSRDDTGVKYLDAPDVHFDLSYEDVLVIDLVIGVPCQHLLTAVDNNDEEALAEFAAMGIDPQKVAMRLLTGWNWQVFDFLVFHGDPHPANIMLQPGNKIVLIDFGACGYFNERSRRILRQVQYYLLADDFRGMARAAMRLLEPYPPIDLDEFALELEALYARYLHASRADHAEWWERATSKIWMDFIGLARRWSVPVTIDTLRLFRATFLMDTVAFRLHPKLKLRKAYKKFLKEERRWQRKEFDKRGLKDVADQPLLGIARMQATLESFDRAMHRMDAFLDGGTFRLSALPKKAFYILSSSIKGLIGLAIFTIALTGLAEWFDIKSHTDPPGEDASWLHRFSYDLGQRLSGEGGGDADMDTLHEVIANPVYELVIGIVILWWLVRMRRRLNDVDGLGD